MQKRLLLEVYNEAGVDPSAVSYVELHGTGTAAGDQQEANSVAEVFCTNGRSDPLLIGSIKSNMGHPEPASGLAALAKVLIAIHDHAIPANLHFNQPNPDIPGLLDGRLKVLRESLFARSRQYNVKKQIITIIHLIEVFTAARSGVCRYGRLL